MYLQYLRDLGFSNELIDYFSNIYTNSPNKIAIDSLDEISYNKKAARAHHKVFEYKYKKNI